MYHPTWWILTFWFVCFHNSGNMFRDLHCTSVKNYSEPQEKENMLIIHSPTWKQRSVLALRNDSKPTFYRARASNIDFRTPQNFKTRVPRTTVKWQKIVVKALYVILVSLYVSRYTFYYTPTNYLHCQRQWNMYVKTPNDSDHNSSFIMFYSAYRLHGTSGVRVE